MGLADYPDYFLIDLPEEASLTPRMVEEACRALRENGRRYLQSRSTSSLIGSLARVAERWRDREYPLRRLALEEGPRRTGFSREVLARGLDGLFGRIGAGALEDLIRQDLGRMERMDRPAADAGGRRSLATGPELTALIAAGGILDPVVFSAMIGFLARSAVLVKCARGASWLPRLYAHSVYETDPKLGACLEVAQWEGGEESLESALFREIDCLVAMGGEAALQDLRERLPPDVRFLPHGHRVSFIYVSRGALEDQPLSDLARGIASDVIAWNQCGCLSPHVAYVQGGGSPGPDRLADAVAAELARCEREWPRGPLEKAEAGRIDNMRRLYALRQASCEGVFLLSSKGSTAWTVVFDSEPRFQASPLCRFLHVKAVEGLEEALGGAAEVQGRVSTVGLAAQEGEAPHLVSRLARWGASRVCPVGRMQEPPLAWRHDGRPALGDLVRWTDWEP